MSRGLWACRHDRAKEHGRSGDRPGHAGRHGLASDGGVGRVAEHLIDAKSLREKTACVRCRRALCFSDRYGVRRVASLRERLPDRAAEGACRCQRRGP